MSGYLMEISDQEFKLMRELIYERFGINLTDQKRSLMVGRLQKVIRSSGFNTFQEYYEHLINDSSEKALSDLIDRISTNHTFFNREKDHFRFFVETALPSIARDLETRNRRDLRIWCAGCSTGEEPYMLLMLLQEFFGPNYSKWDAGILATDISQRALGIAREGCYPEERISSLPDNLRNKYFRRQANGNWTVLDRIRNEATFRRFNLMNAQFPFKKPFHIIFCRNVMIYFDQATREALIRKFHQHTEPGGYLFIGHSETIGRDQSLYKYLMPATYQREKV
ncbi:MAG: protein-glutamate O-methyltransferase CheR [Desulfuromonadaceae bacterium]